MKYSSREVLEDGRVKYTYPDKTTRFYTPRPDGRKRRKPDDPRYKFWRGDWLPPLPVLPEEERVMPITHEFKDFPWKNKIPQYKSKY